MVYLFLLLLTIRSEGGGQTEQLPERSLTGEITWWESTLCLRCNRNYHLVGLPIPIGFHSLEKGKNALSKTLSYKWYYEGKFQWQVYELNQFNSRSYLAQLFYISAEYTWQCQYQLPPAIDSFCETRVVAAVEPLRAHNRWFMLCRSGNRRVGTVLGGFAPFPLEGIAE